MSIPSAPASTPSAVTGSSTASTATHGMVDSMSQVASPLPFGGKSELVALPYTLLMIGVICVAIGALKSRGNRR